MIDVKKLIAGFLILATGSSFSILIFSYVNSPRVTAPLGLAINSNLSPIGKNAFVSQPSSKTAENILTPDVTNNPNNLTGNLTGALLNGIVAANPNGPKTDANGNPIMTPPDQSKIIAELTKSDSIKKFKAPNWDVEAVAQKLNMVDDSASATIAYAAAFHDIFEKYITKTNLQSVVNQNAGDVDPDTLAFITFSMTSAFKEALNTPTPSKLVSFQKSFIKILTYGKNTLQATQTVANDPVKLSLILRSQNDKYQAAINQFESEAKKNSFQGLSAGIVPDAKKQNGNFSFLNSLFSTPTAHAIGLPTWDILGDTAAWTNVANQLGQFAKALGLQLLKNTLLKFVQNKTLAWIQGSGAPRFIQDWGTTFVNAYAGAAAGALNSITPQICPTFGPLVNVSLKVGVPQYQAQTCTLNTGYDFTKFYNDFSNTGNGNNGWDVYYNMLEPNNNFYSQLMTVQDTVEANAMTQQNATQSESTASFGYTGDTKCDDNSNPYGAYCWSPSGTARSINPGDACGPEEEKRQNKASCNDGSTPKITTPGHMTAEVGGKALGSSVDLIISAQSVTGIITALSESLMTSLFDKVQQVFDKATADKGGVLGIASSDAGLPTTENTPVSCSPPTQTISVSTPSVPSPISVIAMGGDDADGNPPTYSWNAPDSTPVNGTTGVAFVATYSSPGTHEITVTATAGHKVTTATCKVVVPAPVSCAPLTQTIYLAGAPRSATINATGGASKADGTPPTYTWSVPGYAPTIPAGAAFVGTYSTAGTYVATVTASTDNTTSACSVIVQP